MIRKILVSTDPLLRQKSKPVGQIDKKITQLIKDLKDTISVQNDPEGVGLAAPQIGKNLRVFVIKPDKKITAFINPEIISISKKTQKPKESKKIMEGCLSLPHYYGPLKRASGVKIRFLNEQGKQITQVFTGLEAQIILHEIDHLNGILFVDRLLEQKRPLYQYINGEWEEVEI